MIRKIFIGISFIASVFLSLYIETYILKEHDQEKFFVGYLLITGGIFGVFMWAYEWAKVRDERKKRIAERRKQNEIRETNSRRD